MGPLKSEDVGGYDLGPLKSEGVGGYDLGPLKSEAMGKSVLKVRRQHILCCHMCPRGRGTAETVFTVRKYNLSSSH